MTIKIAFLSRKCLQSLLIVVVLISLVGCSVNKGSPTNEEALGKITAQEQVVSVTFGPDRKIWRVVPGREFVFVDFSTDLGHTFSKSVVVNSEPLRIRAKPEDRPSIVVDRKGWIYVLFLADGKVPWSAYLSLSKDGGYHFSEPVLVSNQAHQYKHYQDVIAVDKQGHPYIFWSDERNKADLRGEGNSLYYSPVEIGKSLKLPNIKIKDAVCECCRLAVDFDADSNPVVLSRTIYGGSVRDHGVVIRLSDNRWLPRRITYDQWGIEACPEHGPALSIGQNGRYHITWFTQGSQRKGLFYAHSDDRGATLSSPVPLGDSDQLPGHADVLVAGDRVALVWQEFDGVKTMIKVMQSANRGDHWSSAEVIAESEKSADYPFLISDGQRLFVSWNTEDFGYKLIPLNESNAGI